MDVCHEAALETRQIGVAFGKVEVGDAGAAEVGQRDATHDAGKGESAGSVVMKLPQTAGHTLRIAGARAYRSWERLTGTKYACVSDAKPPRKPISLLLTRPMLRYETPEGLKSLKLMRVTYP